MIEFIIIILLIIFFMVKQKDVYTVAYELGKTYLDNIICSPNYAVMFDIDDTLILNDKPIKPIINLIKECNKRNIQVLIITARDSIHTVGTIEDLLNVGIYPNPNNPDFTNIYNHFQINIPKNAVFYDFYYLRHSPKDDNEMFKSNVKKELTKDGIYTIMSIGDNEIDIIGDYSGYFIKLPNIHDPRLFHKDSSGRMVNVKV